MPLPLLVPLAISGISALAGLLANRKKQIQQESTSTQSYESSSMPNYDPKTLAMREILMNQFLDPLSLRDDFSKGYQTEGLNNINQGSRSADLNIENILASRGLNRTSAGTSSVVGNQLNRLNQQNSFLNNIPLLMDKRRQDILDQAAGFWKSIPIGTSTSGTQTTKTRGNQTDPGNPLGGAFGSLATTLGGLYGQGAFGGPPAQNPYIRMNNMNNYPSMPIDMINRTGSPYDPVPQPVPNTWKNFLPMFGIK